MPPIKKKKTCEILQLEMLSAQRAVYTWSVNIRSMLVIRRSCSRVLHIELHGGPSKVYGPQSWIDWALRKSGRSNLTQHTPGGGRSVQCPSNDFVDQVMAWVSGDDRTCV